ncbi:Cystathionine beta-lyase [Bifidobacterium actinocoloniiforme DSM 22766]|uniref:cysteine-S-conjugate beta-lyase n=1 Tax=Bifidobacterium actinocoloniiforme DSM 22766 TaxID=1437605 RepID=A0A086Z065_9BIFI|nr:MalY/PatB family protein [Bifidobacterium actinocoloniiforme]AKV55175.1 plastocyanin [Bifidobacterium actinocoloniiforme DSM 22766]KFI39915.1 Cystathionine beta-lyase [Bifidobacterium actinocoloniiforme DSM 22766]
MSKPDEYDFTSLVDRRGTNSYKWDVATGELPMWVADMDFRTAPEIINAMRRKLDQGVFGYEEVSESYYQAVADWYGREHGARPCTEWMLFVNGVVPALSSLVRRLTQPGDQVLVQAPVYDIFFHSIENNGRHVLSSDLVYDPGSHRYHVDEQDLEAKLAEPLTRMMILCNPHNPAGKVWSRQELERTASLCERHGVSLVSDEIHGDLVFGQPQYTPLFALPPELLGHAVSLVSPSKSFNLAALHAATIVAPGERMRESISRGINNDELAEPNLLAVPGTIAAYEEAGPWLHALLGQLERSRSRAVACLEGIDGVEAANENATYLLWMDISALGAKADQVAAFIREDTGLYLSSGSIYRGNGDHFLRMNLACPPSELEDGLERLARGVRDFRARR